MALSPDFDPDMRSRVIPEARRSFSLFGEIFVKDPSLLQAINMGLFSKIDITPEEASLYKTLRDKPSEGRGSVKCDQVLMAEDVLTGDKSAEFKKAFPQIFPPLH